MDCPKCGKQLKRIKRSTGFNPPYKLAHPHTVWEMINCSKILTCNYSQSEPKSDKEVTP